MRRRALINKLSYPIFCALLLRFFSAAIPWGATKLLNGADIVKKKKMKILTSLSSKN
jgi:hypothetical protein